MTFSASARKRSGLKLIFDSGYAIKKKTCDRRLRSASHNHLTGITVAKCFIELS